MIKKEPVRNRYVGHRYVPMIMGEWDQSQTYEGLSIVLYQGNSYTSNGHVPVGIPITNEKFWRITGNYNAQVEGYRQDVIRNKKETDEQIKLFKEETGSKLADMAYNVKDFGIVGDGVADDTQALQLMVNNLPENSTVLIPAGVTLKIGLVEFNKELAFTGSGKVTGGTLKPNKAFRIDGITFENSAKGIDFTGANGNFFADRCTFDKVDFPIFMDGKGLNSITESKRITLTNNTITNCQVAFVTRAKKSETILIDNNVVDGILTTERYAMAFRIGASGDEQLLIKTAIVTNNHVKNIRNMGSGSDWECCAIGHYGETLTANNNILENIWSPIAVNDCEAIYSKGKHITINDNILIEAGGDEGAICVKGGPFTSGGLVSIENNKIFFGARTKDSKNLIGILVARPDVTVKNNHIHNAYTGIESYGLGGAGLQVDTNKVENSYAFINYRTTDQGALNADTLILNNKAVNCDSFVRTVDTFETNGKMTIKNNNVSGVKLRFFNKRGKIKSMTLEGNEVQTVTPFTDFLIEMGGIHADGETLIINNNNFGSLAGRVLVVMSGSLHYYPYIEINNNTIRNAERGFGITGTIDVMVVKDNKFINVTGFQLSSSPTLLYRKDNIGLADSMPV